MTLSKIEEMVKKYIDVLYYFVLLVSINFFVFYDTSLLVEVFKGNTHFVYLFGNNNATRIHPFFSHAKYHNKDVKVKILYFVS